MSSLYTANSKSPSLPLATSHVSQLSVVIPCFNEEESIEQLLESLAMLEKEAQAIATADGAELQLEFLLVDDGSSDRTFELLTAATLPANYRILRHPSNRGIAAAIQTGIVAASYEVIGSIDADCSYDPGDILRMLAHFPEDAAMAVASPYHPQGNVLNIPAWRLWLSKRASLMYSFVLRQKLHTYTSCFRLYRRSAVANLELSNPDFVGITELVWRLDRAGHKVVEVPAVLSTRKFGQSKMRVMRATLRHLGLLSRAAIDRLFSPFRPYPKAPAAPLANRPC